MDRWLRFFLGTPRRFLATFMSVAFGALYVAHNPGVIEESLRKLLCELSPLIMSVVYLLFLLWILRAMLHAIFGGGRKK